LVKTGREKREALSALKVCAIGGEKATPELLAQLNKAGFSLRQIMGQTETSILLWASEEDVLRKPGSVMKEYWQDPVRTEETIKNGWLRTGDLARMDEEGYFYLVDRARDMYISGGENVYPAEVERVLRKHPDIEEAAVIGVPDEDWGEVGHAFVIRREGSKIRAEDVISFCNGHLARFKWPKKVSFCNEFPQTALGKVRKNVLLEQAMKTLR